MEQVSDVRDRAMIIMLLETRLRPSELAALSIFSLELPNQITKGFVVMGIAKVTRGNGRVRSVHLNWKVCEAVNSYLNVRDRLQKEKATTTFSLFLNKYGQPISHRSIQRSVERYLKLADIENASVYALRL